MASNATRQTASPSWVGGLDVGEQADPCACAVALKGREGQAYNQEAFRYLLDLERKRSEISNRPFLLLLVDLKKEAEATDPLSPRTAEMLFGGLWRCLRETDFVGWYRDERVVGAVLTQRAEIDAGADISRQVAFRVNDALRSDLPALVARRLQVRVYQLPPTVNG